jgi:cytochrome P450
METLTGLETRLYHVRSTLLVVLALYVSYRISQWIYKAYRVRTRFHDIPSLPRHLIWGNLINAGERLKPSLKRHPDYGFEEIWRELGEPGCFLVDLAPIEDRGFLIIAEPQYAEALVNSTKEFKYSIPKSSSYQPLKPVLGAESIITQEGAAWRAMRKRFNPGFQPSYIHSLTGSIVSRVEIFVERLQSLAESGITFKMADYAQDLTADIITQLTIAQDFNVQSTPEGYGEKSPTGLLTASRRLSDMVYAVGQGVGFHMIDPIRPLKSLFYESIFDHKLTAIVKARISSTDTTSESKSITQLAVSGLSPNKALIRSCVDQIKSFLFAGQDTTATLIQWICYEMSKASHSPHHATILSRLRQEHDAVFGPTPFSALQILSSPATAESELILTSKLPYTTAFIKETLRLHPPAATVRAVPWEATSLSLPLPSHPVSIAGLQIYPSLHLIQRNPNVWGPDAHLFNPGRWLDDAYLARLPVGAYRPFERGPRNCIGQELAMLEGMVVLVSVARGFVFEKVGLTGRAVVDGGEKEREVWNKHAVTSVPVDGMVMRVSMGEKAIFRP